MPSRVLLAFAFLALALPIAAAPREDAPAIRLRWNDDLLRALGLAREGGDALYIAPGNAFDVATSGGVLRALTDDSVDVTGGARFARRAGEAIEWSPQRLRVVAGDAPRFDFVGASGDVLFRAERLMTSHSPGELRIATGDLRISSALAARIGRPRAAGLVVADVTMSAPAVARDTPGPDAPGDPNWPGEPVAGVPGATYRADVFMLDVDLQFSRCSGCDGPDGQDGLVVFTPSSTLGNNVNSGAPAPTVPGDPRGTSSALWTADIPWYPKFSVAPNDPDFAYPYPLHDQHPFLVWNLYRIDADGRIVQVGASGVKHAFQTQNAGAACDGANGSNVLGRACSDLYSVASNDLNSALGPRSEIVPAAGQWGRCGSIFDADCDGVPAPPDPNGPFGNRMLVLESDVDADVHPGATWYVEAWYVVRDDVDVRNTMATRAVTFFWDSGVWYTDNTAFRLGPAIDRWVAAGAATNGARSSELATPEGNATIAARATPLGNGTYRYDYAVMNLDFARAQVTGVEANHTLRVLSSRGFARFSVSRFGGTVSQLEFADGNATAVDDWVATVTPTGVQWLAPGTATLDWGRLLRFSFVSSAAPTGGEAVLAPWVGGAPASFAVATVSAGAQALFADGFE